MPNPIVKPEARSPYQRYGKVPTLYSAEYQAWRNAIERNNPHEVERADRFWQQRHGRELKGNV